MGAQAAWLRRNWDRLPELVPAIGESATLDSDYAYGLGLHWTVAAPSLSVATIARSVKEFHTRGDQAFEAAPEDFEKHRITIEAMLKASLWHWEASEARSKGEEPPEPSEEALKVMGYESNAIRM
jgi:hypothetical protein